MADALASIQVAAEFVIESALVSAVDRSIGLLSNNASYMHRSRCNASWRAPYPSNPGGDLTCVSLDTLPVSDTSMK